jgi:hypothetical protein
MILIEAPEMERKVKDMTVDELRSLIADATRENIEDLVEDMLALSSDGYLRSIDEARADYKKGRIKRLED